MKFFIQACLIVSLFLFFGIDANAGANICTTTSVCFDQGKCEDIGRCAIGAESNPSSTDACSWCGTFCADSCPTTGPVTIIPTMGQWGMIIATILLGFFAVFAIRRRIKS